MAECGDKALLVLTTNGDSMCPVLSMYAGQGLKVGGRERNLREARFLGRRKQERRRGAIGISGSAEERKRENFRMLEKYKTNILQSSYGKDVKIRVGIGCMNSETR